MLALPLAMLLLAGPAPTQAQFVETRRVTPALSFAARAAAAADFDGDGDLDVLHAGEFGVRLARNVGAAVFEAAPGAVSAPLGAISEALAGDLDGDGDVDALAIPSASDPGMLLLNQGGVLTHAADVADASGMLFIEGALGDLDLDGDLDVFLARNAPPDVQNRVLFNDGTGVGLVWNPLALPALDDHSRDVALGDLDGDGALDAYVSQEPAFASPDYPDYIAGNLGNGTFQVAVTFQHSSRTAALADLDGDGDLDAYAASAGLDRIVWNPGGSGPWTTALTPFTSTTALATDLSGDGRTDLLVLPGPRIARGIGGGSFVDTTATDVPGGPVFPETTSLTKTHAVGFAHGDFDGDDDVELYWPQDPLLAAPAALWLNDGGTFGHFSAVPSLVQAHAKALYAAAGDLDGDGHVDLFTAMSGYGHLAALWRGTGTGEFQEPEPRIPHADLPGRVLLGDLDGDGDLDALFERADDQVCLNDGTGGFTLTPGAMPSPAPGLGRFSELGDVDGDGDLDVLGTSVSGALGLLVLHRSSGSGTFVPETIATAPLPWLPYPAAFATLLDADGDGDLDLIWSRPSLLAPEPSRLLWNDGTGGFVEALPAHLPQTSPSWVAAADVDLDGDVDAVASESPEGRLLRNDGTGMFTAEALGFALTTYFRLEDVDGDDAPDLVDVYGVFHGDGTGAFDPVPTSSQVPDWPSVADVDGDGDGDVLGTDGGQPVLLTNLGGGQVARRSVPGVGKPLLLEVFGEGGAPWALAASPGTARIPLGGFGTLLLDPGSLWPIAAGVMPVGGMASVTVPVANDPLLLGVTVHWQALTGASPSLSAREATTVTSY